MIRPLTDHICTGASRLSTMRRINHKIKVVTGTPRPDQEIKPRETSTHETLCVFPDNHHIDNSRVHPLDALDWSNVGVKIEVFSQRDDGRAVSCYFV